MKRISPALTSATSDEATLTLGPTPHAAPLVQAAQRRAPPNSRRCALLQLQKPLLPRRRYHPHNAHLTTQERLVTQVHPNVCGQLPRSRSSMDKEVALRQPPWPSTAKFLQRFITSLPETVRRSITWRQACELRTPGYGSQPVGTENCSFHLCLG